MEDELQEQVSLKIQVLSSDTDHEAKPYFEQAEGGSHLVVRKSSRPRKQSKRALDSADCHDDELLGLPLKKKHRKNLKLKTGRKKDILPNGRQFRCSLCESAYINNSPAKAKSKKEVQPIMKERNGQLLQLCVKCAIAVNHTENKGPTPEQRAEFEEEGKLFAQNLVEYLNDSAAARLYCSFYQTTKCGCIQCYITGTPANRKRKISLSGSDSGTADTVEPKIENGPSSIDDKADQSQRAKHLLGLLKESLAKKRAPSVVKKSNEKGQQEQNDAGKLMKESEEFILANRMKLKELGICERGCQKVLCYSNNFLHKKTLGSQPRLQRTKGRAALGRLHALQDLHNLRCCEKNCVKQAERNQDKIATWRERAQQNQKEMWMVLEEMLTSIESGKSNCFKFISMVTGCCLTTVQKVYADILLSKGAAGCASKREHGMRFHWKRQKELAKPTTLVGQTLVSSSPEKLHISETQATSAVPLVSESCPILVFANQAQAVPLQQELEDMNVSTSRSQLQPQQTVLSQQAVCGVKPEISEVVDGSGDKQGIKQKFLQLCEDLKDPQELASVHKMLEDILQRNLKMKKEREQTQQGSASRASGPLLAVSLSSSVMSSTAPILSCSSAGLTPHASHAPQISSSHSPKIGRPFVHIKVPQSTPVDQAVSTAQYHQPASREQVAAAAGLGAPVDLLHSSLELTNSAQDDATQVISAYTTKAEASTADIFSQPLLFSSIAGKASVNTLQHGVAPALSLPVVIGSDSIPFLVGTASSADNSQDNQPQLVSLFQVVQPGTDNSLLPSQVPQILSVCPQSTPQHNQPLSTGSIAQQLQLVSPLVIGQSDLNFPVSHSNSISLIIPKHSAISGLQDGDLFHEAQPMPSTSIVDHKVIITPSMQQLPQQNTPGFPEALNMSSEITSNNQVTSFTTQTGFSSMHSVEQESTPSIMSSGLCPISQPIQYQSTVPVSGLHQTSQSLHQSSASVLDQASELALPLNANQSKFHTFETDYTENDLPSNISSSTVMNSQGNQNHMQESTAETPQLGNSIDQCLSQSLLSQVSGNTLVGTPSSCSSGSFVFDALADSPVKDSSILTITPVQPVPVVTSSLLCEMLMRSSAPTESTRSLSSHMQEFTSSVSVSPIAAVGESLVTYGPQAPVHDAQTPHISNAVRPIAAVGESLVTYGPQAPVHDAQTPHISNAVRPSLLMSALTSPPKASANSQSLNFHTHTAPSTLATRPMTMASKFNQTSTSLAMTAGYSTPLGHSQTRLNRQREPPQVGIVHPHVSGVKTGLGHKIGQSSSNTGMTTSPNIGGMNNLPAPNSTVSHVTTMSESLSSSPLFGYTPSEGTNLQVTTAAETLSGTNSTNQQQLLLSLLLNSQQSGNLTSQPLLSLPQQTGHISLSLFSNSGSNVTHAATSNENNLYQSHMTDINNHQSKVSVSDSKAYPQNISGHSNHSTPADSSNFLQNQALLSVGSQTIFSLGNRNILLGSTDNQLQTTDIPLLQASPNTGLLKLVPVIISDSTSNASMSNLLPQNSQLDTVHSLNPQNLTRDSNILLNMSPNTSQSISIQHSLMQVGGGVQPTSVSSIMLSGIHQVGETVEATPVSKDQAHTMQFNVVPVGNNPVAYCDAQKDYNSISNAAGSETHMSSLERELSTSVLSGSVGLVAGTVQSQELHINQSLPLNTGSAQNMLGSPNQNLQSNYTNAELFSDSQSVFLSGSKKQSKPVTSTEVLALQIAGFPSESKSDLWSELKTSKFSSFDESESHSSSANSSGQAERKPQVALVCQAINEDRQNFYTATATQQHQVPLQVMSLKQEQSKDMVVQSGIGTNLVHGQPGIQNLAPGQVPLQVISLKQTQQEQSSEVVVQSGTGTNYILGQSGFQNLTSGQVPFQLLSLKQVMQEQSTDKVGQSCIGTSLVLGEPSIKNMASGQQCQVPIQVVSLKQVQQEQNTDIVVQSDIGTNLVLGQPGFQNITVGQHHQVPFQVVSLNQARQEQSTDKVVQSGIGTSLVLGQSGIQNILPGQQRQVPFQVINLKQTKQEQSPDSIVQSAIGTNLVFGQSGNQNVTPGQLISFSYPNQIILQPASLNQHFETKQALSSTTKEMQTTDQQLSEMSQVLQPLSSATTSVEENGTAVLIQATKSVSTSGTCTFMQSALANSGSQHTNTVTSCSTTGKLRPIRPRLIPVPSPTTATKISLMLVPDKSGFPTYQLAHIDQGVLSVQQLPEQHGQTEGCSSSQALATPQHKQNSFLIPGISQQLKTQKPTINTAIVSQSQSNTPTQILLVSRPDCQGIPSKEPFQLLTHQNEALPLKPQQMPTNIEPSQVISQQESTSHHLNNPYQSAQSFANKNSSESGEITFIQNETLKVTPAHGGTVQSMSSLDKVSHNILQSGPLFITALPTILASTSQQGTSYDVHNMKSGRGRLDSLLCGSEEAATPTYRPSQITESQLGLQVGHMEDATVGEIPTLDLQSVGVQITSQKNLLPSCGNLIDGQSSLLSEATLKSKIMPVVRPKFKDSLAHKGKLNNTGLDILHGPLFSSATSSLQQSKLVVEEVIQQSEDNTLSVTVAQSSAHMANSIYYTVQQHSAQAGGADQVVTTATTSSKLPSITTGGALQSNQLLPQQAHPFGSLAVHREDTKPSVEPVQYLQCKEVIDLTNDSPPISPSGHVQKKRRGLGLASVEQPHSSALQKRQPKQAANSHITALAHPPYENLTEQSQQLVLQVSQLKQEAQGLPRIAGSLNDGSDLSLACQGETKEPCSNLMTLEDLPEDIRRTLIATFEAHAAGNPDVQVVTRTLSPGDDLTCQGLLSSKSTSQQTEDQVSAITRAIRDNKCPSAVVTISTNQRFQQSLANAKPLAPQLPITSTISHTTGSAGLRLALKTEGLICDSSVSSASSHVGQMLSQSTEGLSHEQLKSPVSATSILTLHNKLVDLSSVGHISAPLVSVSINAATSSDKSAPSSASFSQKPPSVRPFMLTPLVTAVSQSPAVRAPSSGRSVIHPPDSAAVAFMRTTTTPTDAVGPPNITIMSPTQASSSSLLRLRHDSNSICVTAAAPSHVGTNTGPCTPVARVQTSSQLKLVSTPSLTVSSRSLSLQNGQQSAMTLCPDFIGKGSSLQTTRRLSLENISQTSCKKEIPALDSSSTSLNSRSVGSLIKSMEQPAAKPGPRKRKTVMDLLKNKEKQQASAAALAPPSMPVSGTPGPVTLMFSGVAGAPNLLVMGSPAEQTKVDTNALNIEVKNIHLIGKGSSSQDGSSSSQASGVHTSGFTLLQPTQLQASLQKSNTVPPAVVSTTFVAISEQNTSTATVPSSVVSHVQHPTSIDKNISQEPLTKIHFASQTASDRNPFLKNLIQSHQGALDKPLTSIGQFPGSEARSKNLENESSVAILATSILNNLLAKISTAGQSSDPDGQIFKLEQKHLHGMLKSDRDVQLPLIDQSQVAGVQLGSKEKSPVLGLSAPKNSTPTTDKFRGEKLKFKSGSEDRPQETVSHKFNFVGESHRSHLEASSSVKSPSTDARASKKATLLINRNEIASIQPNTSFGSILQVSCKKELTINEQKQLQLKTSQHLQLMKSKQFSPLAMDQTAYSPVSLLSNQKKCGQLPAHVIPPDSDKSDWQSSVSSNAGPQLKCHLPRGSTQKDQTTLVSQTTDLSTVENQVDLPGHGCQISACRVVSDARQNLLPAQNPLLANILFTGVNSVTSLPTTPVPVSLSVLPSESHLMSLVERRISSKEDSHHTALPGGQKNPHHNQFEDNLVGSVRKSQEVHLAGKTREKQEVHLAGSTRVRHEIYLAESTRERQEVHLVGGSREKQEVLLEGSAKESHMKHLKQKTEEEIKPLINPSNILPHPPPAYNQPPRYDTTTRVKKVIEDIYNFPDEGDEQLPPPIFGGQKLQLASQRYENAGHRSSETFAQPNDSCLSEGSWDKGSQAPVRSNMKSAVAARLFISESSVPSMSSKPYPASDLSSSPPQVCRNPKKVKPKKDHKKSSHKHSLKKVKFSDVVTSKPASEFGQTIVSSSVDAASSEESSSYQMGDLTKRGHEELNENQYSFDTTQALSGRQQRLAERRQDSLSIHERHPYVTEQLEAEDNRLRTFHSSSSEADLMRSRSLQPSIKDMANKDTDTSYSWREAELPESIHLPVKESYKTQLSHQHPHKMNQIAACTGLAVRDRGLKQREDKDISLNQSTKCADENVYPLLRELMQGNVEDVPLEVIDKEEACLTFSIQSGVRPQNQSSSALETSAGTNHQQVDETSYSKAESSVRDPLKKRQLTHEESCHFLTAQDYGTHSAERVRHNLDTADLSYQPTDGFVWNSDRDAAYDQLSSFNILSSQGYSKLSRQKLNRAHSENSWSEDSPHPSERSMQYMGHSMNDTSCSSDQSEDIRDFSHRPRCDTPPPFTASSAEHTEIQPSESPQIRLKRQEILESNFELARQMKKEPIHILKDYRMEAFDGEKLEIPHKVVHCTDYKFEGSRLTPPLFPDVLNGRTSMKTVEVLSSIESLSKEIKDLSGMNHFLKLEVAKAEHKEQQRQKQLSSADKQRSIHTETDKMYHTSPSGSQQHMSICDIMPLRKRHPSIAAGVGNLSCSPHAISEQQRTSDVFQSKLIHPALFSSGFQQMLESDMSLPENGLRSIVAGLLHPRGTFSDDSSPIESYIRHSGDPCVSISMSSQSRPSSQLDQGLPQYEFVRHRYPSSEMKPASSKSSPDGDSFLPLPEHTRHRNLSSSLGMRLLPDIDPPPYDVAQRQRNPSASSIKSTFQDAELLSFDLGTRSRNPSSSSWGRHFDGADAGFSINRSRNPSGSSNRRSRPGSSSSDRELVNMDELPSFSDIVRTRSRNSSGESIEPTMEFLLDPQQFMQYTYHTTEALIKRTKH